MSDLCITNPIGIAAASLILGVSEERTRQLDRQLRPLRIGRTRIYARAAVERYAASVDAYRAAKRGAR